MPRDGETVCPFQLSSLEMLMQVFRYRSHVALSHEETNPVLEVCFKLKAENHVPYSGCRVSASNVEDKSYESFEAPI